MFILQGYNYNYYGNLTLAQYTADPTASAAAAGATATTATAQGTDNNLTALNLSTRDPNLVISLSTKCQFYKICFYIGYGKISK